jgi:hypothetical protein
MRRMSDLPGGTPRTPSVSRHPPPGAAPPTDPTTDRRCLRGRATRLAIVEALRSWNDQRASDQTGAGTSVVAGVRRVSGRALAAYLQLHPTTVYARLKRIQLLAAQEMLERQERMVESSL